MTRFLGTLLFLGSLLAAASYLLLVVAQNVPHGLGR